MVDRVRPGSSCGSQGHVADPGLTRPGTNFSTGGFIGPTAVADNIVTGGTAIGGSPFLHGIDATTGEIAWQQPEAAATYGAQGGRQRCARDRRHRLHHARDRRPYRRRAPKVRRRKGRGLGWRRFIAADPGPGPCQSLGSASRARPKASRDERRFCACTSLSGRRPSATLQGTKAQATGRLSHDTDVLRARRPGVRRCTTDVAFGPHQAACGHVAHARTADLARPVERGGARRGARPARGLGAYRQCCGARRRDALRRVHLRERRQPPRRPALRARQHGRVHFNDDPARRCDVQPHVACLRSPIPMSCRRPLTASTGS